jgi:hypothetical protein
MNKYLLVVLLVLLITACSGAAPSPTPTPMAPAGTATADWQDLQIDIRHEWEASPHAHAQVVIGCDACHQLQDGVATSSIAWRNQKSGQYEPVSDGNQLCVKCHAGYDDAKEAHASMNCLDCHDHHSIKVECVTCHIQVKKQSMPLPATPADGHPNSGEMPSCEAAGCHTMATQVASMPSSIHGTEHAMVACEACHDAGRHQVGLTSDGSVWVLGQALDQSGKTVLMPYRSHNLQYKVECIRCHYDQNPWGLHSLGSGQSDN